MFIYDFSMIILIPALILAFYAQFKVKSSYKKFARVSNSRRITGGDAARYILDRNGLSHIRLERVSGELTDHYDPRAGVIRLSSGICDGTSIASISVAAHEVGHAIQYAQGYKALTIRNSMVPVVNFASNAAWPLAIIGLFIGSYTGSLLLNIAVIAYAIAVLFQLVTLPVEFNASRRAISQLEGYGLISDGEEKRDAERMLKAAAMTYVAAAAVAVANLLRIVLLANRND